MRNQELLRGLVGVLKEIWRGANGDYAFDAYCRHTRQHHPERPPPTRAEFEHLKCQSAHNGIRRCC